MDPIDQFKDAQRKGWSRFERFESFTTVPAARLVGFAGIRAGQAVLDVGCGTGVVALTAARMGARASGLDLTPELIARANESSKIAGLPVEWKEGDAESLPWGDASFDVVVSQFGHMFAPRPDVTLREMLRVLKPGGTLAFATWPPDLFTGRMFVLVGSQLPPLPPGASPPAQWGVPAIVRERLGSAATKIAFDGGTMLSPALSTKHFRAFLESGVGPVIKLVEMLSSDPAKLEKFRGDLEALIGEYFADNVVRQDFLLTRAVKA